MTLDLFHAKTFLKYPKTFPLVCTSNISTICTHTHRYILTYIHTGSEPKCQKKIMMLHEKAQQLNMFQEGKRYAAVGHNYIVNEINICYKLHYTPNVSTVRTKVHIGVVM